MWEKGIELCKELAHQYENETFDFIQLSAVLVSSHACFLQGARNVQFPFIVTFSAI